MEYYIHSHLVSIPGNIKAERWCVEVPDEILQDHSQGTAW